MLRARVRAPYGGQNGPNSAASMPSESAFRTSTGLFRQFQHEVRRITLPRTWVNMDMKEGRGGYAPALLYDALAGSPHYEDVVSHPE
jgi:hypothetical protein